MGYRVQDICYPTTADALSAFKQLYPSVRAESTSASDMVAIDSATINSSGKITYTLYRSTGDLTGSKQLQLEACTTASSFKDTPIRDLGQIDMMVIVAFIFVILLGFGHGLSLRIR